MRHRSNSIKFIPNLEKSTKNSAKPRRTKLSESFSATDRQTSGEEVGSGKGAPPELREGPQQAVDIAALVEAATASMLRALRQEKNGRLAFQVLKTFGGPMQCSKNYEDRRSEKEKRRDNTVKAMTGMMMAVYDRGEAWGSPIDAENLTLETLRNHKINLVPAEEKTDNLSSSAGPSTKDPHGSDSQ